MRKFTFIYNLIKRLNEFKNFILYPIFIPKILIFFNWKKKVLFIFCYFVLYYLYLHFIFNVTYVDLSIKDFFFLLKLKGFLYYFLLLISFLSSFPWLPLTNLNFKNFFRFFFILTIYHTIFVVVFLILPEYFFL